MRNTGGWVPDGVSTAELVPKPRLSMELGSVCRLPVEDGWASTCEGERVECMPVCVCVCVLARLVLHYQVPSQMWTFEASEHMVGPCECHPQSSAIPGRRANNMMSSTVFGHVW